MTLASTLTATVSSTLSEDVVMTDLVAVYTQSPNPVATFSVPVTAPATPSPIDDALAIVDIDGTPSLYWVARTQAGPSSWTIEPVPSSGAANALEVVTGTTYPNGSASALWAFFTNANGLYAVTLGEDGSWTGNSSPIFNQQVQNLGTFNTPGVGQLVVYAITQQGELLLATQYTVGGPFIASTVTLPATEFPQGLTGYLYGLSAPNDTSWAMVAALPGATNLTYLLGYLPSGSVTADYLATSQIADLPSGATIQCIGPGYYAAAQASMLFFVGTDSAGVLAVGLGQAAIPVAGTGTQPTVPAPAATIVQTTLPITGNIRSVFGQVTSSQLINLFAIDENLNLWVNRQAVPLPNISAPPLNWTNWVPLARNVLYASCDKSPIDSPSVYSVDDSVGALRLAYFDSVAQRWAKCLVRQSGSSGYTVSRFRTEFAIVGTHGAPVPNCALTLSLGEGSPAVDVCIGGVYSLLTAQAPLSVTTDIFGRVTVAVLAGDSLAAPTYVLQGPGLAAVTANPAAPIQHFLSGRGPLNPWSRNGGIPTFGADTLAKYSTGSAPLSPIVAATPTLAKPAAQAIINFAQTTNNSMPAGAVGLETTLSRSGTGASSRYSLSSTHIRSRDDLSKAQASQANQRGVETVSGTVVGDLLSGLEAGLAVVESVISDVVSVAETAIHHLVVAFEKGVKQLWTIYATAFPEAAAVLSSFFQFIGTELLKLLAWLLEEIDFPAIWAYKEVIQSALPWLPTFFAAELGRVESDILTWMDGIEAKADHALDSAIRLLQGKTPPTPSASGKALQHHGKGNVSSNWFSDHLHSSGFFRSAQIPPALTFDQAVFEALVEVVDALENAANEIGTAVSDLWHALEDLFLGGAKFATLSLSLAIEALKAFFDAVFTLVKGIIEAGFTLVRGALNQIADDLTEPLDLGPLNTFWSWLAAQANSSDTTLTMAAVTSLIMAFPTMIIGRIIGGSNFDPTTETQALLQHSGGGTELKPTQQPKTPEAGSVPVAFTEFVSTPSTGTSSDGSTGTSSGGSTGTSSGGSAGTSPGGSASGEYVPSQDMILAMSICRSVAQGFNLAADGFGPTTNGYLWLWFFSAAGNSPYYYCLAKRVSTSPTAQQYLPNSMLFLEADLPVAGIIGYLVYKFVNACKGPSEGKTAKFLRNTYPQFAIAENRPWLAGKYSKAIITISAASYSTVKYIENDASLEEWGYLVGSTLCSLASVANADWMPGTNFTIPNYVVLGADAINIFAISPLFYFVETNTSSGLSGVDPGSAAS